MAADGPGYGKKAPAGWKDPNWPPRLAGQKKSLLASPDRSRRPLEDIVAEQDRAHVIYLAERGYKTRDISHITHLPQVLIKEIVRDESFNPQFREAPADVQKNLLDRMFKDLYARQLEIAKNPPFAYDVKGGLVTGPDGGYLRDTDISVKALAEARKAASELAKLHGAYAPTQRHVTIAESRIDAEVLLALAELERVQRALPAGDIVEAEVVSEQEAEDERGETAGQGPRHAAADDAAGSQGGEEQQDERQQDENL